MEVGLLTGVVIKQGYPVLPFKFYYDIIMTRIKNRRTQN